MRSAAPYMIVKIVTRKIIKKALYGTVVQLHTYLYLKRIRLVSFIQVVELSSSYT